MFGTTDGQIIVMSSTGAMVTQVTVLEGMEITTLIWSCEKFNMEESEDNRDSGVKVTTESGSYEAGDKNFSILHLSCRTSDLQFSLVLQTHALVL